MPPDRPTSPLVAEIPPLVAESSPRATPGASQDPPPSPETSAARDGRWARLLAACVASALLGAGVTAAVLTVGDDDDVAVTAAPVTDPGLATEAEGAHGGPGIGDGPGGDDLFILD